jgi:hypothetical protein
MAALAAARAGLSGYVSHRWIVGGPFATVGEVDGVGGEIVGGGGGGVEVEGGRGINICIVSSKERLIER